MATIQIEVLFKKIQKDDKKEVLEFHILGSEIPHKNELVSMAGGMVVLQVVDCEEVPAEFKSVQRDSKKAVLKFNVKGNYTDRVIEMYKRAGGHVQLLLAESQLSIDDVYEPQHEGIEYGLDTTGVVSVDDGQLTIDEIEEVPGDGDYMKEDVDLEETATIEVAAEEEEGTEIAEMDPEDIFL